MIACSEVSSRNPELASGRPSHAPQGRLHATARRKPLLSSKSIFALDPGTDSRVYTHFEFEVMDMLPGQLARLTQLSTDTLRHYERVGLLPPPHRTRSNYRDYPSCSPQRVRLIQRALDLGFSLAELKTILAVRDQGGAPCQRVRRMMNAKIDDLRQRQKHVTLLPCQLTRIAKAWDRRLKLSKQGQPAFLLENVPLEIPASHPRRNLTNKRKERP